MSFWIKNILFVVILLSLTYLLLPNIDELNAILDSESPEQQTSTSQISSVTSERAVIDPTQHVKKSLKTDNAASKGLSRFYANLHGEFGEEAKIRNNVVYLPDPTGNLKEILQAKALLTRPLKENWRGLKESRPFRKGETLFQKLSEYAERDGLEVIWWLNRDLVIKDPFRIEKEMLKTAYLIGNAVEGHFPEGVTTYFCYKQRSIVLIDKDLEYLQEECMVLNTESLKGGRRRY
ncbi:TcpQ domain-containing protein [Thalassotalea atypica]|uniref:TcpQ domain-containing protein n=1 Tax=Thalassotalea atypica TaxID=2054316 RepID=UPI0025737915|nr:TcpQ domain-containing protein [Thalassotalea atypica]